jgi:hypothetical protein
VVRNPEAEHELPENRLTASDARTISARAIMRHNVMIKPAMEHVWKQIRLAASRMETWVDKPLSGIDEVVPLSVLSDVVEQLTRDGFRVVAAGTLVHRISW